MGHVAVVRRSMRPEEWTDLRFVWLQRGIVEDREEVTGLTIRDAEQISENEYAWPDGQEERPLNKGDQNPGSVFRQECLSEPENGCGNDRPGERETGGRSGSQP